MERAVAEFFRGTWKPPPSDMQTSPPSSVCTGEGAKGSEQKLSSWGRFMAKVTGIYYAVFKQMVSLAIPIIHLHM